MASVNARKTDMERYYQDVLLISEIAKDDGIAPETIRLLTYIHARCMNGGGAEYFSRPDESDVNSLAGELRVGSVLVGAYIKSANSKSCLNRVKDDLMANVMSDAYRNNDRKNPLFGENILKLRLYTDEAFRNETFGTYVRVAGTLPVFRKGAEPFGAD
jgi:hypothetical protein